MNAEPNGVQTVTFVTRFNTVGNQYERLGYLVFFYK